MVKVGFICEGESDKIIIDSVAFGKILKDLNIEKVNAINADGVSELNDSKRIVHRQRLLNQGAACVIVLRDKDEIECFTKIKGNYNIDKIEHFVIAEKELESWFLADGEALTKCLGLEKPFSLEFPEIQSEPFEFIKNYRGGGIKSKTSFAKKMVLLGFSIENAANHPNCHSAKYFIKKLKEIGLES